MKKIVISSVLSNNIASDVYGCFVYKVQVTV